jgi:serine/threonine protein kinase
MAILPGRRLGPYEIVNAIGAGGMGEVYKARDTRLDRIVAIKVLPTHLADRSELRERFEREAKTIASLNHPHICTLYDTGHQDDIDFLVMEYLEGETLAQRLQKGPLPLEQVLLYAIEISDALDKAHRKGITHRDLKPGNIMLTKSGTKLLDFGLAKLKQEAAPTIPDSQLPTMKSAITGEGTILGTLQYMAPEQVESGQVDARTDIFAFGAVVYEMATGKKAFEGKTSASVMAKILEAEPPPMASLQPMTPPALDRVVKRCLAKEPEMRWQAASDLCEELKWISECDSQTGIPAPVVAQRKIRERVAWTVAVIAVVAALALAFPFFRRTSDEPRVLKMSVLPPEKTTFSVRSLPAVSPDGRRLAFVFTTGGKEELWVRDLDSLVGRALTGTDGASYPFWSPDSRTIAFFADQKLKKIEVAGGPALTLCDAINGRGGTWNNGGVILFGVFGGSIFRVSAAGGSATALTAPDKASGETDHRVPWFLPDGRHFLYTATNREPEKVAIYVGDLDSKNRKLVVAANSNAVYSPPGYLLFVRERTLMVQPFDVGKLETTGDAIPIAEQVDSVPGIAGQNQFSVSQNGVMAYTSGASGGGNLQLTWLDRSGRTTGTVAGTAGGPRWPAISPDGNTVAVDRLDPQTNFIDLWLHDLARGGVSRFTFNSGFFNAYPVWSPDGSHIAFRSTRDGAAGDLYQKATSGAAREEVLDKDVRNKLPNDWSRDGRYIIEGVRDFKTKNDIWVLPLFGDRKPFPYLQTEFNEQYAKLAPNGQWLAYASDETKRLEVYVQTFPTPGGKWQVSTNGGDRPVWSRDGKELYFIGADGKMMAVQIKGGTKFEAGVPKPLFDTRFPSYAAWYDVSKDGRFLIPAELEQASNAPLTVVVNWTAGLKK